MKFISLSRLLRLLLWLALLTVALPVFMIITAPMFLLAWALALVAVIASRGFREQMGTTRLGVVMWLPLWTVLLVSTTVPALALAHAAALWLDGQTPSLLPPYLNALLRQLPQGARDFVAELNVSRQNWGLFCVFAGAIGVSSNCVYSFIDIPWRLKQIRQVRALPRSKARSAAIGLAEFEGVARATEPDGHVSKSGQEKARPFHLEDETGRILVDPRNAVVRPRSASGTSLALNEIEAGIRDGDRVYVIGNVQRRDDRSPGEPDPDRLVVRPLGQTLVTSPVGRLLFSKGNAVADRDAPNIFIVDKGSEHDVGLRLRMALWDFCVIAAVSLGASLWLVQAAWPWLSPG